MAFLLETTAANATSDGYEVAARYPVVLGDASAVAIGNGGIGLRVAPPQETTGFLEAGVTGEHWRFAGMSSDSSPRPAIRVPMASISAQVSSTQGAEGQDLRLSRGATYTLCDGVLSNRWETRHGELAADLTVAPTQNLVLLSFTSDFPFDATLSVRLGEDAIVSRSAVDSCTTAIEGLDGALVGFTRILPEDESYGVGVTVAGKAPSAVTTENGCKVQVAGARFFDCRILFVESEEGIPLLSSTTAEARIVAGTGESELRDAFVGWWYEFWNRSVLDLSGSDDSDSTLLERAWVRTNHALATHSRGSFPPCDSGFWMSGNEGRVWHPTLWLIYGGWALSGHGGDIGCLSYPLLMDLEGDPEKKTGPFDPLLPLESGPDGVPGDPGESLNQAISEIESLGAPAGWDPTGPAFSSLPLLASLLLDKQISGRPVDSLYPFLRANANRAMDILDASEEAPLPETLVPHLLVAIESAGDLARWIGVDPRSQSGWRDYLERYGHTRSQPFLMALSSAGSGENDSDSTEVFLRWLEKQSHTPEGVALTQEGVPSLLKTGCILQRILGLLADETDGVLRVLPGIPMMGSWSAGVERVSVPSGLTIDSLPMRNGVVDSFLLRSPRGGVCRLELPQGWTSAQLVRIGEIHEPVQFEAIGPGAENGNQRISFPAEEGDVFLVGPIW